jgi:amidohydrolase
MDFLTLAAELRSELVERRRDLHRHPELGYEEFRTAGIVADELNRLGLEVQTGVGKTGVVGILEGAQDGPTVLVRADMDALPILEENTHDYTSTVPGKMHACGHDAHTTIALGVAKLLMAQRDQIKGRIKFVFQPAEEGGGGARAMIADGVLGDPRPDVSVGLHVWADMPVGVIGLTDGSMMAGASLFRVVLTGHGGHGAMPHLTIDPVPVAGLLISALNGVVGRKVDALSGAVLTVTSVRTSSEAYNVIPQSVELRGTLRTFEHEVAQQLEQRIREISTALASAHECRAEIEVNHLTIPVVNDAQVYQRVHKVFTGFGDAVQIQPVRTMASEDVSFLMDDIPGLYFFVGAGNAERGITYGHHHPRFDIDEDVLPLSVALLSSAVAEYILPEGRGGA